jgi:TetR/AcrR family transcriptional repressor of nem operon
MPIQKTTKDDIILKSIELFTRQGYHKTTMSDLAGACGLFKGSFYHYFDSKETLMKEVLGSVIVYFREKVFSIAYDESLSYKERLEKMIKKQNRVILRNGNSCFMGNTVLETANLIPSFKEQLNIYFENWAKALAHIYESKYQPEYALKLANQVIMEVEGAIMLVKLTGNQQLLEEVQQNAMLKL